MIYSILFLGTVSCLLLSFFWDIHIPINGTLHSLPLFVLWYGACVNAYIVTYKLFRSIKTGFKSLYDKN